MGGRPVPVKIRSKREHVERNIARSAKYPFARSQQSDLTTASAPVSGSARLVGTRIAASWGNSSIADCPGLVNAAVTLHIAGRAGLVDARIATSVTCGTGLVNPAVTGMRRFSHIESRDPYDQRHRQN